MPFAPGESGNPGGRPKSAKLFRDALLAELRKAEHDVERIQRVARRLVEKAEEGDVPAIKEIADRIDGKVPQALVGDSEHDPIQTVTRIERVIVDPANTDGAGLSPATPAIKI